MIKVWTCSTSGHTPGAGCGGRRAVFRALEEGLSERALELVVRSLGRLGWLGGGLPPLLPRWRNQNADDDAHSTDQC